VGSDAPTGVFVATYAKAPRVYTPVVLALEFPGGVRCEVSAEVAFLQDELGAESPAGFGAKLVSVPEDARAVIAYLIPSPCSTLSAALRQGQSIVPACEI